MSLRNIRYLVIMNKMNTVHYCICSDSLWHQKACVAWKSWWLSRVGNSGLMACIHSPWAHLHNCIFHEVWSMPNPYCIGLCVCVCVCLTLIVCKPLCYFLSLRYIFCLIVSWIPIFLCIRARACSKCVGIVFLPVWDIIFTICRRLIVQVLPVERLFFFTSN